MQEQVGGKKIFSWEHRIGRSLSQPAQRRAAHLLGELLKFLEHAGGGRTVDDAFQQIAHALRADATRRAPAAGFAGRVAHVLTERSGERNIRIKDKETTIGDERLGRIVRREIVEPGQGYFKTGRSLRTEIVNLPVPDPIH